MKFRVDFSTSVRSQLNKLMLHLKCLEKEEQAKCKTSRRSKIIEIWAQLKEIEMQKPYKELTKQKADSLKK
jgi:hypothetical protein